MSRADRFLVLSLIPACLLVPVSPSSAQQDAERHVVPDAVTLAPPPLELSPEEATEAYLSRLSDAERERSNAYFEGGYWLQLVGLIYGVATAWVWLGLGWASRLRLWCTRIPGWRFVQDASFVVVFLLGDYLLSFPLTLYQGFFREHAYGLANQSFGPWMQEQFVGLGVASILGALAFAGLYVCIRKTGSHWWIWASAGAVVFLSALNLLFPVFVAPLFNTYVPIEAPAIREPILRVAEANGIPVDEVYQFDASRQSNRISANVSGFLGTMRISLNDNLLNRCSLAEIEAVMAHEMGHYVLNHVYEGIISLGIVLFVGFGLVHLSVGGILRRFGARFGIQSLGDIASLPLLGVLLSAYFFAMTPVTNTMIRANEAEADIFGLNAAGQPDGFAEVSLKLGEYRKLAPTRWEEIVFFDHPSGRTRILMAMRWRKAQQDGQAKHSARPALTTPELAPP